MFKIFLMHVELMNAYNLTNTVLLNIQRVLLSISVEEIAKKYRYKKSRNPNSERYEYMPIYVDI